jgi:glutamyl-tRNA synthetase
LDYDEGPFYQTHRFDRYNEVIDQLIQSGQAYYCDCSRERLEALREQQMANKQKPRYDGCCRDKGLSPDTHDNLVVRFRNPDSGEVVFKDLVKGVIRVANSELDDLIIKRSDGTPTYNLTVVVDDMDMQIDHVVRGDDHVNNTPRQINILQALGAPVPLYAHVPMILGEDGKRLSKRHGAVSVMQYKEDGFLPQALLNYLVRLGWSSGDQEIFSRDEMVEAFSLEGINRAASTFNPEKLAWLNQHYMKTGELADIAQLVKDRLSLIGVEAGDVDALHDIVALYRERTNTINELADAIRYFYQEFDDYDVNAAKKVLKAAAVEPLQRLLDRFESLEVWSASEIHRCIGEVTEALQVNMGKVGQPLRVAVTGGSFSPPIDQTVEKIGQAATLSRMRRALDYIENKSLQK